MSQRMPVEVFPPGDFIREELEERSWTQEVLAEVLGTSLRLVNEIITGRRAITPATARALGEAFDTGPTVWMNLESAYRLSQVKPRDDMVARRAKLYGMAPIKEMIKRSWIEHSPNIDVLEDRVKRFFEIESLDDTPSVFPHAARKSTSNDSTTMAQCAWLIRARGLAKAVSAVPYTDRRLRDGLVQLRTLLKDKEETRHVPRVLAEAGVRLVLVEALPGSKIDGAAFWLDAKSPVIALSLRYDRVDGFWHTLIHDLMHLVHKDVAPSAEPLVDVDLIGEGSAGTHHRPDFEQRADKDAVEFLVPQERLENFIARVRPLYSKKKIRAFAATAEVHPGIVVGQLQHRGEIPFSHSRDMLEKVRDVLCDAALADGWGHTPQLRS
jgi:HTH-type transcriptional regulator / antitoxin HigA